MGLSEVYYHRFAEFEAHGVSELYESWALGVADDEYVQSLIESLPRLKWQANLIFASARWNGAPLAEYSEFRPWLVENWQSVAATAMARFTQTNEAGRCSVLLPQLARIPGPLALIEVGASAGLCLYPDRYSYEYSTPHGMVAIDPWDGPSEVLLKCEISGDVDLPRTLPEVAWRAGIDLTPIDVSDAESLEWLETLVWPEHDARRARLRAAARVVANDPPLLVAGDLTAELRRLVSLAPADATLVIFHSAVLAYLSTQQREQFVDSVRSIEAVWLSNEGEPVLPWLAAELPAGIHACGEFLLGVNGHPVALTGPHGQRYRAVT